MATAGYLGFGGALILATLSFIYNIVVSIRPIVFYLKESILFISRNIKALFDKEKGFVKFNQQHPEYEKMYLYLLSALLVSIGTYFLFFFGFTNLLTIGFVGIIFLLINNLTVTVLSFTRYMKATTAGKLVNILFTILALQTFALYLNKIAAYTNFMLPKFLEWIIVLPSIGYAMFQAFFFVGIRSYLFPALILIPLSTPLKFKKKRNQENIKQSEKENETKEKKKKRDVFTEEIKEEEAEPPSKGVTNFLNNGSKGIMVLAIMLLLVFSINGIGIMKSFSPYVNENYSPSFPVRSDFEFGVSLTSISNPVTTLTDYEDQFSFELELLKELNVSVVRLDVRYELVKNSASSLQSITNQLHSNGFKIMILAYGYSSPTWSFRNVSLTTFVDTFQNQSLELLSLCQPEYLVFIPEPYGYSTAFLNEVPSLNAWTKEINNTANLLHSYSNDTEVGVSLSFNGFNPYLFNLTSKEETFFEKLWKETTLDFVGLDFFFAKATELNLSEYLDLQTPNNKDFWILDFGLSSVMYSERIQSAALTRMLEICVNDSRVKGLIYFSLIDDTFGLNTDGLVAESRHKRLAFEKYKAIIQQVKG
ncbi:MAG: hypothetical protein ACTSSG_05460 [Candidatus Heimdallarchaeaceae archaeon]